MKENEDILTLEEAEEKALSITEQIAEQLEISDPTVQEHLFSQSLLMVMKEFETVPSLQLAVAQELW